MQIHASIYIYKPQSSQLDSHQKQSEDTHYQTYISRINHTRRYGKIFHEDGFLCRTLGFCSWYIYISPFFSLICHSLTLHQHHITRTGVFIDLYIYIISYTILCNSLFVSWFCLIKLTRNTAWSRSKEYKYSVQNCEELRTGRSLQVHYELVYLPSC